MDYKDRLDARNKVRRSGRTKPVLTHYYDQIPTYEAPAAVKRNKKLRRTLSWVFQIALVILFAYMLVYCFGQTQTNVGQSMDPTLAGGDTVLINTLAYQIGHPERGDVICFSPGGTRNAHTSIKRVIGLPGETIQIVDGMVQIDGKTYIEDNDYPLMTNAGMLDEAVTLGDNEYFVLGDNRNNSEDSRFTQVGMVTSDTILGKVWYILSPKGHRGKVE